MKKYVFGLIITTGLVLSTATQQGQRVRPSALGRRFLNDLQAGFLPD